MMNLLKIWFLIISIIVCKDVFSFQINHNGHVLIGTESNFTFAKSIWTNNESHFNFKGSNTVNYLLIDDIFTAGSLQISSILSQSGAEISLYRLDGSSGAYTSVLVKTWSDENIIGRYYIQQPSEYLVEVHFPGEEYPHITFDFFPDKNGQTCIHLAPDTGLTCEQSWLPAHYRREVEPWIRTQINEIGYLAGGVEASKELAEFTYLIADSAIDAVKSTSNPASVIEKKAKKLLYIRLEQMAGQKGETEAEQKKYEEFVKAGETIIEHGIVISKVFAGSPDAVGDVVDTLISDVYEISLYATGVYDYDILTERFNETKIAWIMLETYIQNNYGDWSSLAVIAGLNPDDNPSIYEIIDGIAASLGYENHWYDTEYDLEKVNSLFYEGVNGFGDWVEIRRVIDNPLDDVDGDGYKNREDADPNDPLIPYEPLIEPDPETHAPVAVILPLPASVNVNTQVMLDGSGSYDPDNDAITTYQWVLGKPSGSNSAISGSGANVSFTPDISGNYTVKLWVIDESGATSEKPYGVQVSVSYGTIPTGKIALPTQWLVGAYNAGVDGPEGWNHGLNSSDGWCVNVGPTQNNGCFNAGEWVEDIAFWLHDTSGDEPVGIAGRKGNPPTIKTVTLSSGSKITNFDRYDWLGADLANSSEVIGIDLPGQGTYYLAAYAFAAFDDISIFIDININDDIDDDGVVNEEDDFPRDFNRQRDSDKDGVDDKNDAFPSDPAASVDSDGDGFPNNWNSGKGIADSTTGLILDHPNFINDPAEWADIDDDGIGNNADKFDNDSAASVDSDDDGYPDSWNAGKSELDSETGLVLDRFPNDSAAAIDDDDDKHPDRWNQGKTQFDSTTGLTFDWFPNDINEWADSDFDGVGDNSDWAPQDYSEWVNSDGDSVGDNADPAPNDPNRWTNVAPAFGEIVGQEIKVGEALTIPLAINDGDGDSVSIQLLNAPGFLHLDGQNIMVAPAIGDVGNYAFIVRADDGFGGIATKQISISVVENLSVNNNVTVVLPVWLKQALMNDSSKHNRPGYLLMKILPAIVNSQ